ncbi:hypothetical protein [Nitriliruptor alkaliphilus]|uniref:hypothetical protein n=1 Tax=Nitriliruptor alkaliphilus TaxID=427918 RepID=UPI0012EE2DA8|nr:hypothetical protein [Nitriliruptor alkaliphilus]
MAPTSTAAELIPDDATLEQLRTIAASCTACDLHRTGTRTVFGEGAAAAARLAAGSD